jgi:Amidohydrolase family
MPPRQLFCGLAIATAAVSQVQAGDATTVVLRNLTIIDGNGGSPLPGRNIVIRAGRVAAILMAETSPPEKGAPDVDLAGHYAIPGLVDSHVHLSLTRRDPVAALRALFQGGVTAMRDMGGDESVLKRLAERTQRDEVPEPRVNFATAVRGSPSVTVVGGRPMSLGRPAEPLWLRNVVGPTDIGALVARARDSGATGIKLYTDLPLDLLKALAARARAEGLGVWGHARIFPNRPSDGVAAGIEVLSHSSQLAFEETNGPENGEVYRLVSPDSPAITRLLREMRARGAILEPTLLASFSIAGGRGIDASRVGRIPSLAWACRVTRRAHELGVTLVAGTDRLNERNAAGFPNIHTELELLVSHGGLTPLEVLTAATRTAARVLGNDDRFGTIAVGNWADLTILRPIRLRTFGTRGKWLLLSRRAMSTP